MIEEEKNLTQYSKGSGCGCKIPPAVLEEILAGSGQIQAHDERLLLAYDQKDDAAVYDLEDGRCLLTTTDFFTPIVDDAFEFGRVAAANALSDIYAMGGTPAFANAILGWPVEELGAGLAAEVLRGAKEICAKAGAIIAGGHSIAIQEPIFGLTINGFVNREHLLKNDGAKVGDVIYLTKPLGVGILAAAMKRGVISSVEYDELLDLTTSLNDAGPQIAASGMATAMTDVTGFGFLGHLLEMTEAGGLSAEISMKRLPVMESAQNYINQYVFPDNTYRNWNAFSAKTSGVKGMDLVKLCDPQTSGGLLIAVDPSKQKEFEKVYAGWGSSFPLTEIGHFTSRAEVQVKIV